MENMNLSASITNLSKENIIIIARPAKSNLLVLMALKTAIFEIHTLHMEL